ncbi:MAG: response regulator [Pseudomonadota bacterium]
MAQSRQPPSGRAPLATAGVTLRKPRRSHREQPRIVRVLLAEDHPINQRVVELILANAPVRLTITADGAEAVSAVEHGEFDLVLMDLQMPVMDGLAAMRRIRALETDGGRRPCRICVLTANADPDHRALALEAGADDFLAKPVDAETLLSVTLAASPSPSLQATAPKGN